MSKISIYHSSIKVKSKKTKSRFSLKIIISGQRPYFIKDFLQRFLAKQPPKHPYKFRLNSDD